MKKITYDIEWKLEISHWWFIGRRRLLKFLLSTVKIPKEARLIDIGCGVGSNLGLLQSLGFKLIGVDSEIYSLAYAKRRFPTIPLINGNLLKLPFKTNSIDLVIATDILEHLEEDTLGLREIYRVLKWKGEVLFTVPAFNFLWGIQDVVGMHKKRYSRSELIEKIEQQGFKILKTSYFNFLLFFPILFTRRLVHLLGLTIESENQINLPIINIFLTKLFSIEAHILRYFTFPFGVSIFCIAQK